MPRAIYFAPPFSPTIFSAYDDITVCHYDFTPLDLMIIFSDASFAIDVATLPMRHAAAPPLLPIILRADNMRESAAERHAPRA